MKQRIEELERQALDQEERIKQLEAKRAKRQRNIKHSQQRESGLDKLPG
jgi:membrane protein involved in colicin uptake